MKSITPEAKRPKGVFQIPYPICGVTFSNNISIISGSMRGKNNLTRPLKALKN